MFEHVFKDINIAEFTIFGLGPVTGKFFSHFGATVVRVESSLRPDPTRMWPPFGHDTPGVNRGAFWAHMNTSKRSISLNLKHPKAADVTKRLIEWSDIVIENFTPGVVESWGLSYNDLVKIKPDIIMLRISNLGHTGPHATQRGTGSSLQGLAGFTNLTGWPDRGPSFPYGAISDQYPPPLAASCLIAALLHRKQTGEGQYIDLSQLECSIPFLAPHILDYAINGKITHRAGNSSSCAAPHGAYRCKGDDRWCVIAVFTEQEWNAFCHAIGNPPWTNEPQFRDLESRKMNEEILDKHIEEWTQSKTAEEVMTLMQEAGVASGVVETPEDMLNDSQLIHRNHFPVIEHPEIGTYVARNDAFRFSTIRSDIKRAPLLGEDNEFIFKEQLGLSEEEYVQLLLDGVLE
jgi:benzylsuccinate CoA-transferase BbsF subunit